MAKLTREIVSILSNLSGMSADEFFGSIWRHWDRQSDLVATLIALTAIAGIDHAHEYAVKDMLRLGIRCAAMKRLIELAHDEDKLRDAFEPSDTDLQIQFDAAVKRAAELQAELDELDEEC